MDPTNATSTQPGPRRQRFEEWLAERVAGFGGTTKEAVIRVARIAYRLGKVDGRDTIIAVLRGAVNQWDIDSKAVDAITKERPSAKSNPE